MTQDFDAVLFDMDGVLIDAKEWHYEALNQALKIFGFSINATDHEIRFDGLSTKTYAGIINLMEVIVTNEDVKKTKPHPECYLKAMNDLGVSPGRTIVIEDGDYGVTAATKAGARVLKVSGLDDVNIELLSPFIKELSEK